MQKVFMNIPYISHKINVLGSWISQEPEGYSIDLFINRYNPFPGEGAYKNLEVKNEIARDMFISGDYDYFFNVEDDILLPGNALALLLNEQKPLISGLYRFKPEHSGGAHLGARIYDPQGFQDSDDRFLELRDIKGMGDVITCVMTGMGCLLIDRDLMMELRGCMGHDVKICQRAREMGIDPAVHTGVYCGHIYENGHVLDVIM